jgi:hypothetical protein
LYKRGQSGGGRDSWRGVWLVHISTLLYHTRHTEFGWRRALVRGGVMAGVLFVAESLPNFAAILSFVGSLTINLCTFALPSVFYVMLVRQQRPTRYRVEWTGFMHICAMCFQRDVHTQLARMGHKRSRSW